MPNRIKDLPTQATLPASDDVETLDGLTNGTRKVSAVARISSRNTLAPRGGITFDGTVGSCVTAILTGQPIGTDSFSIAVTFKVPTANPTNAGGIVMLSGTVSGLVNAFAAYLGMDGHLLADIYDSGGVVLRSIDITNLVSNYGGKVVSVVFSIDASGRTLKTIINGATVSTDSNSNWGAPVNSTLLVIGRFANSTRIAVFPFYSATFYNLALSTADALEIFEIGGAVPERFKWGSQVNLIADIAKNVNITSSPTDWNNGGAPNATITADTANSQLIYTINSAGFTRLGLNKSKLLNTVGYIPGKAYQFGFTLSSFSGLSNSIGAVLDAGGLDVSNPLSFGFSITGPGTCRSFVGVAASSGATTGLYFRVNSDSGTLSLTGFNFRQVGAIAHLPLDDGLGLELQDMSSNRLHAVATTNGFSHVIPSYGPISVRGKTSTSGNEQLLGAALIPANSQILRVRARAQTGTPTATLGTSSGLAQLVASTSLSQTWKDLTIALTGGMTGGAASSLWVNSSTADVIEWHIDWEPLSA